MYRMKYIAKLSPSFQAKIMQNIVKAWSKIVQIVIVSSKTSYVLDIQLHRSLEYSFKQQTWFSVITKHIYSIFNMKWLHKPPFKFFSWCNLFSLLLI